MKPRPIMDRLRLGEDILALAVFFAMIFIPVIETVSRWLDVRGIPAAPVLVQHLTLWIGFIGAVLAAQQNKLLSLSVKPLFNSENEIHFGRWMAKTVSFIVIISLMWGSIHFIKWEFLYPVDIAPNIPRWFAQLIIPIGFALIAFHILKNSGKDRFYIGSILMVSLIWFMLSITDAFVEQSWFVWFGMLILLLSLVFGAPIFVGLGGIAALLFWMDSTPIASIPAETYRIVVSPTLPTIPLFTLAGYLLAESKASERMFRLFSALFGWIPGGTPVVVVLLCGFFTALTGGSGVTILALGGLLYPLLKKEGYSDQFTLGLITVAGSIGLLFPPSLPAIIYSVTAGISVKSVFIAGLIPGILLIVLMSGWSIFQGRIQKIKRPPFNIKKVLKSIVETKWEILIPIIILSGVFAGFTTLVETAAISVVYILFIEVFVYKDLSLKKLPGIIVECATLVGGVLIILGVAMGLTSYFVDAQVPAMILTWVKTAITSKLTFLLMLNVFLLAVGCFMDIFSAMIVIAPLIAPIGAHFGINPIHLAVIFIANLELGFFTPPVGMNLFLSAYRFNRDMPTIYKSTLPFFFIRLIAVLVITYVPFLSLFLLN
ncbi:MAG: TRAP transporter large permease subunit [Candidatus Marinimicrobia bacterium]|nr:TRAP transporter large permease subunit [Candidatus Neomarinimicrobiota bacterium]